MLSESAASGSQTSESPLNVERFGCVITCSTSSVSADVSSSTFEAVVPEGDPSGCEELCTAAVEFDSDEVSSESMGLDSPIFSISSVMIDVSSDMADSSNGIVEMGLSV